MIEKMLKNLRNSVLCGIAVGLVAMSCADTALAQTSQFLVGGTNVASVSFCATTGVGLENQATTINLTTSDGVISTWNTTLNANWFKVTPVAGNTTPQLLTVSTTSGADSLPQGVSAGTITINPGPGSSEASATINVSATVNSSGCGSSTGNLIFSSPNIVFNVANGIQSQSTNLTVTNNTGTTITLNGTASSGSGFLSLTALASTTIPAGQSLNYQVTANTTGLTSGFTYTGNLNFITSSGNASATIPVTLNFGTSGTGGLIPDQTPLTFNFGASSSVQTSTQTINIKNNTTSTVTITGSIAFGSFLLLQATSTNTVGPGNSVSYQVTGSTSGLVSGNSYSGSLSFADGVGDSVSVPVTLNYNTGTTNNGPLSSNQPSFTFSAALGSGPQFTNWFITNNSSSAIVLNASSTTSTGQNWLSAMPSSQTVAAGDTKGVTITVDPTVLNNVSGTYSGTVTVNANSTSVSTQSLLGTLSVPVTLILGTGGSAVVTVSPTSFTAAIALNGGTNIQTLNVTNNSASSITINIAASGSGLSVSPAGQATIGVGATSQFTVTFNPTGLAQGNYSGSLNITPVIGTFANITIPTTLCYGTTGTCQSSSTSITATPNPVSFTVPAGSTQVLNQNLVVTSSVGSLTVQAFASTSTNAQWLTVTPSSAAFNSSTTFVVSVSPQFLPSSGVGTGTITLIPSSGTQLLIPVNVNTGSGALTINPSQLSFAFQTGTSNPPPQNLTISSASSIGFTINASTSTGGNWLIVSPLSGATAGNGAGSTISVSVNPSSLGLGAGSYSGQIVVTNSSTLTTQTIPVTLLVSVLPILSFSNSGTTFNYQFGSATLPTQQTVQITSSGTPLSFSVNTTNVTGGNFLTVTPSNGSTPQTLTLSLNAGTLSQLAPGTYTTNVSVLSNGAGNSPVTYPVTLNVTNNTVLNASQSSMNFNYQIGQAQPGTQVLSISSSGQPLAFTVTPASTNCGNFLTATSANTTTPGQVAVGVNVNGLTAGTCTGTVSISSASAGNSPLIIPVTLIVSNSALLNVSPGAINITTQLSNNPGNQLIALTSTDPNNQLSFTVNTAPNSNFLTVGPTTGNTPNNVTVGFVTTGLAVGTYTSNLTITATGPSNSTVANSPVTVPITVVVTSTSTASTTPSSLTFNQAFSGSAPPNQTLQVNSTTNGLTYSASASTLNGGNWLSVSSPTGTTPGTVTVSANGSNLGTGTYTGFITVVIPGAANSPLQVQVTLNVGPSQTLTLGSSNLSFTFASGATTPQPQAVTLSSNGGNVAFTAATSATSGTPLFVTVTPTTGTTPASLSVGLNGPVLAIMAAGTYTNQVVVSSAGLASVTISVTLTVQAAPAPTISTIVNGASLQPGAVSPGEVVTILGTNLGPTTGVLFSIGSDGKMSTSISGTTVTFDGVLAPLIFVRSDQVNAIVPYEIGGRLNTNVVVTRNTQSSTALQQKVVETSPAIFTLSQTGNGQGAILNSNSSVNGTNNPATRGTVIQIFATGEGALVPGAATGSFTPSSPPFPKPIANVSVTIGGQPATITYAGEAPGLVSGALQVNAIVPQSAGTGPQNVVLTVGANQNITQVVTVQVQ